MFTIDCTIPPPQTGRKFTEGVRWEYAVIISPNQGCHPRFTVEFGQQYQRFSKYFWILETNFDLRPNDKDDSYGMQAFYYL